MHTLRLQRPTSLLRPKRVCRRLPVYCDCGGMIVLPEAPVLRSLGFLLKLVRQLRREGQFIGIHLDARYCFQAACDATCAEEFHAELLDTLNLTTETTEVTREELAIAVRAAYAGQDLRDALCGCVWSGHQLGRSFAE